MLEEFASRVNFKNRKIAIDAQDLYYRDLNRLLRYFAHQYNPQKVELYNVHGQRYIATNLRKRIDLEIYGTPGNDLGAFMEGPKIIVYGNAQDGCGNTMDAGEIIIHGHAGDILGMAMRGGKIFVKENVGYRTAIHMKAYAQKIPIIIIGGTAQDFFGEYMAGGIIVLLGLNLKPGEPHKSQFIGTGMHGGVMYIRGEVRGYQLGKEVSIIEATGQDYEFLKPYLSEFAEVFKFSLKKLLSSKFIKLLPRSTRPYGKLYTY